MQFFCFGMKGKKTVGYAFRRRIGSFIYDRQNPLHIGIRTNTGDNATGMALSPVYYILLFVSVSHCAEQFFVVEGAFHSVFDEFHSLDGISVGEEASQNPHSV